MRADELGRFLQRAATATRREGIELRVVGIGTGSLLVKLRAFKAGARAAGLAAKKEARENPLRTGFGAMGAAGAASVLLGALSPHLDQVTPLASEAAKIVHEQHVTSIRIITIDSDVEVMNPEIANDVRRKEQLSKRLRPGSARELAVRLEDEISGEVVEIRGGLHFRPDGFRFIVPIELSSEYLDAPPRPYDRYLLRGKLNMRRGQPDYISVYEATPDF